MANFPGAQLTDQGRQLQSKAQIGTALTFTRVALGDGSSSNWETMTGLGNEMLSLSIQDHEVVGDGTSRLRVIMTNENLANGFFVRELGVFARDPDTGDELLYSYTNAGNQPDFLPAGSGASMVENVFDLYTVIGNAQSVTAVISDYITIATKQDIDKIRPQLMPVGGLTHQLARKRSNEDGDVEWFDPEEGVNIAVDSLEERRVAVDNQRTFRLATVTTRGLAVYLNGQRLPRSGWEPLGETQVRFAEVLSAGDEVLFVRNEEVGELGIPRVSLDGPSLIYPDSVNTYTITDYDGFAQYAVTASRGSVSRSGDTITLDLDAAEPSGSLDLDVTRDGAGVTYALAVGEQTIATPELTYPGQGDTGVSLQPTLQLTPFKTYPSGADTQLDADYQIATDPEFTDIVWESLDDTANLTAITVDTALPIYTVLYGRGRQHGTALGTTEWTPTVTFTTTNTAAQPVITSPAAGATDVAFSDGLTITASAFNFPGGGDDHTASDWELRNATTQEMIASTTNDGANLTTWTVDGNSIPALVELEVRNRYKGRNTGYTPWAEWSGFSTGEPMGEAIFTAPGSHNWTVPEGVSQVCAVAIGGGGGGGGIFTPSVTSVGSGGGGGGLCYTNNVSVTPGDEVAVIVGKGGRGEEASASPEAGGTSSFFALISAYGGKRQLRDPSKRNEGGQGEGGTNFQGGSGGNNFQERKLAGGGGGAAGYNQKGGNGSNSGNKDNANLGAGGGGGVGLKGGADGGYGAFSKNAGIGGSGGNRGQNGISANGGNGGRYGGGGGGTGHASNQSPVAGDGAPGAVRIIWGPGRSFPDNAQ